MSYRTRTLPRGQSMHSRLVTATLIALGMLAVPVLSGVAAADEGSPGPGPAEVAVDEPLLEDFSGPSVVIVTDTFYPAPTDVTVGRVGSRSIRSVLKTETGSGGSSSASGCREVKLTNKKFSYTGTDHLYTYWTWTYWCWNRANKRISNVSMRYDWYCDNSSISWEGQSKADPRFYDWINGYPYSGHDHDRTGTFKNTYPIVGEVGTSYPRNIIRAHSDGTWTWRTED